MEEELNLREELSEIAALLDSEKYPETAVRVMSLLGEEELPGAYEMVESLRRCDVREELPRFLGDFYIALYMAAIREGNADAMNDLGAMYYEGRGCKQDFGKAFRLYEMAALNGSRQAQENLGYCYYYGRDVEVNYEKAFHFFLLGALDGHHVSLYKIGDMYLNGYYVPRNEKEAFRIYDRCIKTMTDEAAEYAAGPVFLRLGDCFLEGRGVTEDAAAARTCYQKAESFLYDMVLGGDKMYRRSLQRALDGQAAARAKLMKNL